MKQTLLSVSLLMVLGVAACTKESTTPTTTTTTTVAATTTTTSTATTTTTSIPPATTFTLTGLISDSTTNQPIPLADIEIIEGANIGRTFRADGNGLYSASGLTPGSFTMRVRAFGYPSTDVRVTITNANLRVDVPIAPTPITTTTTTSTTTTTVPVTTADFTYSPNPCMITNGGATVDCTVDGTSSTGNITNYEWKYKGKTVSGNNSKISLQVACSDLGAQKDDTIFVTLTVTDSDGVTATVTKGVVIVKSGACGF